VDVDLTQRGLSRINELIEF